MFNCGQVKDKISLYIDNELSEKETVEFEKHIQACEQCRREYELLYDIVKTCNSIEEAELPFDFKQQLHDKLIKTQQLPKSKIYSLYRNRRVLSGVAAGIILVFILKTQIWNLALHSTKQAEKAYVSDAVLESSQPSEISDQPYDMSDTVEKPKTHIKAFGAGERSDNENISLKSIAPQSKAEDDQSGVSTFSLPDTTVVDQENIEQDNGSRKQIQIVDEPRGMVKMAIASRSLVGAFRDQGPLYVNNIKIKMSVKKKGLLLEKLKDGEFDFPIWYNEIGYTLVVRMEKENYLKAVEYITQIGIEGELGISEKDVTDEYNLQIQQYDDICSKLTALQQNGLDDKNLKEIEKIEEQRELFEQKIFEMEELISKYTIEVATMQ